MTNSTILSVTVDGREFDVARVGDVLRVTPVGADELAETISLAHLPNAAREALENSDYDNAALQLAAEGMATAIANRGG